MTDDGRDVLAGDGAALSRQLDVHARRDTVELLVELVPPDPTEVVPAEVEEQALDEPAGVLLGGRVARAQLLVDLDHRIVGRLGEVLVERVRDVRVLGIDVDRAEQAGDLVVRVVAHRPEQGGGRDLALAVHLDPQLVLVVGLELEPRAAVRDDLGREQHPARRRILELAVVDARRADQLAHDDALRAVDDERPHVRHPRVVAHVHALALDLAGLLDQELDVHVQRLAEGEVLGPALLLGVLGCPELVVQEAQLHHLLGEVLDRADLVEQVPQTLVDEPREGLELQLDEVRDLEPVVADPVAHLVDPSVGDPTGAGQYEGCRRDGQHERRLLDGVGRRGDGRAHRRSRIPRSSQMSTTEHADDERGPGGRRSSVPVRWPVVPAEVVYCRSTLRDTRGGGWPKVRPPLTRVDPT